MALAHLNRELVDERRVAAGLTIQQLAERVGVDRWFLRQSSRDDDGVPIGVFLRLSETLDIPLEDLLRADPAGLGPMSEDARAMAALADRGQMTRAQLAAVFMWTLPQTAAALQRIDRRLRGTGLRLRRVGPQAYRIDADLSHLSVAERAHLRHLEMDETGLAPNVAAMLLAIVRGYGTRTWVNDNVEPDDNCIEDLRRAGLVNQHERGIDIVPAVGYSLGLPGWDSPDVEPKRDVLLALFRRL